MCAACMPCVVDFSTRLDLVTLLAHSGANPNIDHIFRTIASRITRRDRHASPHHARMLLYHILTLFHPAGMGVTCVHALDIARCDSYGHNMMEDLVRQNADRRGKARIDIDTIVQCIATCNSMWETRQLTVMTTFVRGTHARWGRHSAIYHSLAQHRLYDAHVLTHIWSYVYNHATYPTLDPYRHVLRNPYDSEDERYD